MNKTTKLQTILLASLLISFSVVSASFGAQAPERMDYQGYIVDGMGVPINDTLTVILSIHDAETSGNQKWTETQTSLEILDGILNVTLGAVTALKDTVFNADTRWLEVKVGSTTFDRVRIASSAYALRIQTVDGATGGTLTGSLTAGKGSFGSNNTNTGTDAFVAGLDSDASGNWSAVGGGSNNGAFREYSTVGGGRDNDAWGEYSVIAGGRGNSALKLYATVGGGIGNDASDTNSTVSGGAGNTASEHYATVSGGNDNTASGLYSTVSGGKSNTATGLHSSIVGGNTNYVGSLAEDGFIGGGTFDTVLAIQASIVGGFSNVIEAGAAYSAIAGGNNNRVKSAWSFIGAGANNIINGSQSVICGGGTLFTGNTTNGTWNFIGCGDELTASGDFSLVVGGEKNDVSGGWAAILGGENNTNSGKWAIIGGGDSNTVAGDFGIIVGGENNLNAGQWSVIGGGQLDTILADAFNSVISGGHLNKISDDHGVICGGHNNQVNGRHGMIPGGRNCQANGDYSIAFGHFAVAAHDGAFVWADSTNAVLQSTAKNQFLVRASGGVKFFSNQDTTTGVELAAGGGSWSSISDSTKKANIREVDYQQVLSKLESMPIKQWSYKSQSEDIEHIGPMAQDFYAAFGLGDDNLTINTIDPDGIALAAIKALMQTQRELQESVNELKTVRAELDDLRELVMNVLSAQNAKSGNARLALNDKSK